MVAWTSSGTVAYSHFCHAATPYRRPAPVGPTRAARGSYGLARVSLDAAGPIARLHVVTGKGGTGKTTVAAALALALAADGRRTCWSRSRAGRASRSSSTRRRCRTRSARIAVAPGGGEVHALAIDAEEALLEYLEMFYNLRRAGRR